MTLEFRCADAGLACDAGVTAETEDELVSQVAEHARSAHDVELNQTLIDYAKTRVRTTRSVPLNMHPTCTAVSPVAGPHPGVAGSGNDMALPTPVKRRAQRLLDAHGPVDRFHDREHLGDFGMPNRTFMEDMLEPVAKAGPESRLGPLEKVHLFWFAGMSCDGCTITVAGAQNPSIESLLLGAHPGLPRIVLHHPAINMEAGPNYMRAHS